MTKLAPKKPREIVHRLEKIGFTKARQKGSHAFFSHPDGRTTVVPIHPGKTIGIGLLRKILKDVELTPDQWNTFKK